MYKPVGIIYKVTNLINSKVYIGQTFNFEERKKLHIKQARINKKQYAFHSAIKKYGLENFQWEIIDEALTREELYEKEKYWIKHYKSFTRMEGSNGYNMTLGGEGYPSGEFHPMWNIGENHPSYGKQIHSEEYKIEMSEIKKRLFKNKENHPWFNRHHSEESKRKMSIAKKQIYGKNHPLKGRKLSEELKKRISKAKLGKPIEKSRKPVLQLSLDGITINSFSSPVEVAEIFNSDSRVITACCRGEHKTSLGFIWIYKEEASEEYIKQRVRKAKNDKRIKSVVKLDKDGNYICRYETIREGALDIDAKEQNIGACCKGKQKTVKGFKWLFESDYLQKGGN